MTSLNFSTLATLTAASALVVYAQDPGGSEAGEGDQDASSNEDALEMAHAILATLAWVIFFPLGAVLMRMLRAETTIWIHALVQLSSIAIITAAAGLGIKLAKETAQLNSYHAILGLILFVLVFVQATGGILHHMLFRKYRRRTVIAHLHIWLGRALITIGMINGGLGLLLANDSTRAEQIAYGVLASVVWLAYVFVIARHERNEGRQAAIAEKR